MKKLLSCIAMLFVVCFASPVVAAPFAVTGEFPSDVVTTCKFTLNSGSAVDVAPIAQEDDTKSICVFDIASSVNGNNVVAVTYTNMWGSSTAVPFSYAKTLPPLPSGIHLKE